jgi:MFS family permease
LFHFGIYASFFLSGLTSLLFEVLWSRQFVTVFGNSSYAISIVLCAYMAGIGLGGLLGGRLADRITNRTLVFGIVQAVIAACALAIPPMLDGMRLLAPTLAALSSHSLLINAIARFGLSFAVLLVPCFLMGTTLPLLARAVTDSDKTIGSRIGLLYCVNTLGAALGCLAGGFWLIGTFGLRATNLLAVIINFVIAVVVLVISKQKSIAPAAIPAPQTQRPAHYQEPLAPSSLLSGRARLRGLLDSIYVIYCQFDLRLPNYTLHISSWRRTRKFSIWLVGGTNPQACANTWPGGAADGDFGPRNVYNQRLLFR